ncbi:restriction endonuclease subunit S [Xanthomonas axonopodis pv. desmodiigangetici]|uniref:restriction endonuclease subunit S n=1 Tax=Xanthomonas axonopodis TaxID=53413 RepID=UPI003556BB0F
MSMGKQGVKTAVPKLRFPEFRNLGGWATYSLSEISKFVTERVGTTSCIPYTVTSGVGLVSQEEKLGRTIAGNSLKNYVVLQSNDFAYNKSATKAFPQGFIVRYTGNERAAVPNSIFSCFRVDQSIILPAFIENLFLANLHGKWLRSRLAVGSRAHGSLQVSDDDLMTLPVPLPSGTGSLAEQQKIADCLTSLEEVIAAQGRKVEALKVHKRGLMQQLFPLEGEALPRLRFPEFRDAPEWAERPLCQVIEVASGQVDPTEAPYCDFPHVGGENIESETGSLVGLKSAREDGVTSGKYLFDEKDVLYSKIRPILNKVAVPDFNGICSADIYPIRPSSSDITRQFLVYLLRSASFVEYATKHSERGKIPKINREALAAYGARLPQQVEQQRIADCLFSVDTAITAESAQLTVLKTHKQGLMQQLFPAQRAG